MGVLLRFATTQEKVATILGREGALRARIEDDVGCEIGGSNWNCLTIWLWGDECQGWRDVQGCSSREGRGTVGARWLGGSGAAVRHLVYQHDDDVWWWTTIWCHGAGARHRSEVIISDDEAVDAVGADRGERGH